MAEVAARKAFWDDVLQASSDMPGAETGSFPDGCHLVELAGRQVVMSPVNFSISNELYWLACRVGGRLTTLAARSPELQPLFFRVQGSVGQARAAPLPGLLAAALQAARVPAVREGPLRQLRQSPLVASMRSLP
jgi:hypothetical protein